MAFSEDRQQAIYIVRLVCSCFSLAGSLFIIVVYCALPLCRRQLSFRLILYLSISDLLFSTAMFFEADPEGLLCDFQAVIISLFGLATVLWTLMISTHAYVEINGKREGRQPKKLTERQMVIFCFAIPTILAVLPFTTDSYGEKIEWCWIVSSTDKAAALVWQLLQFYIPLWFVFAVTLYCVIHVRKTYRGYLSEFGNPEDVIKDEMRKLDFLKWYPIVLFVCWALATVDEIYGYTDLRDNEAAFWLAMFHFALSSLQGFGNAIVYGFNDEVKRELRSVLCRKSTVDNGFRPLFSP